MFFRSWKALLLAKILILVGCIQLFFGWKYADAAKHERTTAGVISQVIGGRTTTYDYVFKIDGVQLQDDSGSCHTALTPQGCRVGASVLVYYAHQPALETMLQDFRAASQERFFFGTWMVSCGLLLIGLYFILKKTGNSSDDSEEVDENLLREEPDELHIVSRE